MPRGEVTEAEGVRMSQGRVLLAVLIVIVGVMTVGPTQLIGFEGEAAGDEYAALIERGRLGFVRHCGACHGPEGKGDGVVAPYLKVELPELGRISQNSGGEFPFDEVFEIIEGSEVEGHGTRAMPVWGPAFLGLEPESDKTAIKEKIVEIVYYLKSIQPAMPVVPAKMGGEPN